MPADGNAPAVVGTARAARTPENPGSIPRARATRGPARRRAPTKLISILDPSDPLRSARDFVENYHRVDGIFTLRHHHGVFYGFEDGWYRQRDRADVRADLYAFLEAARRRTSGGLEPFRPNRKRIDDVLDALLAITNLPTSHSAPCWLERDPGFDPLDIVVCKNGLLYVPTCQLLPHTPAFFTLNGLDLDFDPHAPEPHRFLKFLRELWPNDRESIQTLQEWTGYLLTPRTLFQKGLLLIGPRRGGKGTIGRLIRRVCGESNVCAPTLASLTQNFGIAPLIGKTAAIISDARISGRADTSVLVERLLSLIGEDDLSVPRKFLHDWNGRHKARFTVITNEMPRLEDASGAFASRFIVLTLTKSFFGREDPRLFESFITESSGILNWALQGWKRLYARGRFLQPRSSAEVVRDFEELSSPVTAFLRDKCETGPAFTVAKEGLFVVWRNWCQEHGLERAGTTQVFARDLKAACPGLKSSRPRTNSGRERVWKGLRLKAGR